MRIVGALVVVLLQELYVFVSSKNVVDPKGGLGDYETFPSTLS